MFLEKIASYQEVSDKLKLSYSSKCSICKGTGIIYEEKGAVTCECIRKANIQSRLYCNGMPKKYININWDDFDKNILSSDDNNKLTDFCNNTLNNLFILGNDKIKIMELDCIISNDLAYKKNYSGYFYNILSITVEDLMQTVHLSRNNFELKTKLHKSINNVDILIINYLGDETENKSEQTSKFVSDLIIQRIFNDKLNIISSSLNLEEITNKYGSQFINTIKQNFEIIKLLNGSNEIVERTDNSNGYY